MGGLPDLSWVRRLRESRLHQEGRRRLSLGVIHTFMLLQGIEYSVVLPSLWQYLQVQHYLLPPSLLQSLGVPPSSTHMLGLTLASMTLADILSSLAVGRLLDSSPSTRGVVLVLNCPQVGALHYPVLLRWIKHIF